MSFRGIRDPRWRIVLTQKNYKADNVALTFCLDTKSKQKSQDWKLRLKF